MISPIRDLTESSTPPNQKHSILVSWVTALSESALAKLMIYCDPHCGACTAFLMRAGIDWNIVVVVQTIVPAHDHGLLPAFTKSFGLLLCGLDMSIALGFLTWTIAFRKKKVVKYSQPLFLGMIASGAILSSAAIIPLSTDDSFGTSLYLL